MTWGTAINYNSNTVKNDQVKNVKFFSLPEDENFKRKWLTNIKKENLQKDPKICHLNFEKSCLNRDLLIFLRRNFYRNHFEVH